jgi:hypothetical protein
MLDELGDSAQPDRVSQPENGESDLFCQKRAKLSPETGKVHGDLPISDIVEFKPKLLSYIPLSKAADFRFGESYAVDENNNVYITYQTNDGSSHIDIIDVDTKKSVSAGIEMKQTTIFGGKYYQGNLYLCCFNKNQVLVVSLTKKKIIQTFYSIPSPNDLCIYDGNLYVACGTKSFFWNIPTKGRILRINLQNGNREVILDGLTTLAGVGIVNDILYIARLYDVMSYNLTTKEKKVVNECFFNQTEFLSDNITDDNEEGKIYVALYRSIGKRGELSLRSQKFIKLGWFGGHALTQFVMFAKTGRIRPEDPEQLLAFSKMDEFENPIYLVIDAKNDEKKGICYRLTLNNPKFDGHVTQCGKVSNKLIFVNFTSSDILVAEEPDNSN